MISEENTVNEPRGPKGEHSWRGFNFQTCCHMWVEFVVGSRPCSERFFSGYYGFPLFSESNISKFQFDLDSVPN